MRQHVNPLSKNFVELDPMPPLHEVFENPRLPLHLDMGCASGDFLFELSLKNENWNYLGIEIREKLVLNANLKMKSIKNKNLYFSFGNANNIFYHNKSLIDFVSSISFNFPDPWFKKKHRKRRVIQPELIKFLSISMQIGSLLFIKTDVKELFDYMEHTISESIEFKKLSIEEFRFSESFNPNKIQTNREKYVNLNQLKIYESIYIKI